MKFQLRKRTWLRGKADGSVLLDDRGKSCCIGQLARQCRMKRGDLLNEGAVSALAAARTTIPPGLTWLVNRRTGSNTVDATRCYLLNDRPDLTDDERIRKLRPIFARHGIELEVVE